jgi:hypothetical protein
MWRTFDGGSVLLETHAPAEAIICTVPDRQDRYGEKEVLIDRRRLAGVRVVARYTNRKLGRSA